MNNKHIKANAGELEKVRYMEFNLLRLQYGEDLKDRARAGGLGGKVVLAKARLTFS